MTWIRKDLHYIDIVAGVYSNTMVRGGVKDEWGKKNMKKGKGKKFSHIGERNATF